MIAGESVPLKYPHHNVLFLSSWKHRESVPSPTFFVHPGLTPATAWRVGNQPVRACPVAQLTNKTHALTTVGDCQKRSPPCQLGRHKPEAVTVLYWRRGKAGGS